MLNDTVLHDRTYSHNTCVYYTHENELSGRNGKKTIAGEFQQLWNVFKYLSVSFYTRTHPHTHVYTGNSREGNSFAISLCDGKSMFTGLHSWISIEQNAPPSRCSALITRRPRCRLLVVGVGGRRRRITFSLPARETLFDAYTHAHGVYVLWLGRNGKG